MDGCPFFIFPEHWLLKYYKQCLKFACILSPQAPAHRCAVAALHSTVYFLESGLTAISICGYFLPVPVRCNLLIDVFDLNSGLPLVLSLVSWQKQWLTRITTKNTICESQSTD
jgi:hypothetical protein